MPARRSCPDSDAAPVLGSATRAATQSRRVAAGPVVGCELVAPRGLKRHMGFVASRLVQKLGRIAPSIQKNVLATLAEMFAE